MLVAFVVLDIRLAREGSACGGYLPDTFSDDYYEQLDVEWFPPRVLCNRVDSVRDTREVNWVSRWWWYRLPLVVVVPIGSLVALRRTQADRGQRA